MDNCCDLLLWHCAELANRSKWISCGVIVSFKLFCNFFHLELRANQWPYPRRSSYPSIFGSSFTKFAKQCNINSNRDIWHIFVQRPDIWILCRCGQWLSDFPYMFACHVCRWQGTNVSLEFRVPGWNYI